MIAIADVILQRKDYVTQNPRFYTEKAQCK